MRTPSTPVPFVASELKPLVAWVLAGSLIVLIGWFDFFSGSELRVFPLYYAPISLLAWNVGRGGALLAAVLSALAWLGGNFLGGQQYSHSWLWLVNTLVLAASFAMVGLLISTLKSALLRERALSRTDPLTALHNRRAFYEEGDRIVALCRRKGHPVTLAYLDLDNFKHLNDAMGHAAGDLVLREVAEILRASTRPSDLCARLGGDEFVLLLPESDGPEARVVLERLRLLIEERLAGRAVSITCSVGGVSFDAAPEDMDAMVKGADSRMYVAKAVGKNRLHLEVVTTPQFGGGPLDSAGS